MRSQVADTKINPEVVAAVARRKIDAPILA
jgi:hypothetical protein